LAAASVILDPDAFLVVFHLECPTIEVVVTEFGGEAMFELRGGGGGANFPPKKAMSSPGCGP
jgi:hypothetical protein